jgi:hypothetical protein
MSLRTQVAECIRWREPAVWLAMVFEPAKLATDGLTLEAIIPLSRLVKVLGSYFPRPSVASFAGFNPLGEGTPSCAWG